MAFKSSSEIPSLAKEKGKKARHNRISVKQGHIEESISFSFDDNFRKELIESFENGEGTIDEFFAFPYEYCNTTNDSMKLNKNKPSNGVGSANAKHNFEAMNALVNRIKIECTFKSLTSAYMEYLSINGADLRLGQSTIPTSLLVRDSRELSKAQSDGFSYKEKFSNLEVHENSTKLRPNSSNDDILEDEDDSDIGAVNIHFAIFGNFLIKINFNDYECITPLEHVYNDSFYHAIVEEKNDEDEESKFFNRSSSIISTDTQRERKRKILQMIDKNLDSDSDSRESEHESYAGEHDLRASMSQSLEKHYELTEKQLNFYQRDSDSKASKKEINGKRKLSNENEKRLDEDGFSPRSYNYNQGRKSHLIEANRSMSHSIAKPRGTHMFYKQYSSAVIKPEDDEK